MKSNRKYLLGVLLYAMLPLVVNAQTCTEPAITESTPTADFEFYNSGTVKHKPTGLIWRRCLEGQVFFDNNTPENYLDDQCTDSPINVNWQEALEQAKKVNTGGGFAGSVHWRVPNLKELKSIIEYCRQDEGGAFNPDIFPNPGKLAYIEWANLFYLRAVPVWSSSPVVNDADTSQAWFVQGTNGVGEKGSRHERSQYGIDFAVRLVRFGD